MYTSSSFSHCQLRTGTNHKKCECNRSNISVICIAYAHGKILRRQPSVQSVSYWSRLVALASNLCYVPKSGAFVYVAMTDIEEHATSAFVVVSFASKVSSTCLYVADMILMSDTFLYRKQRQITLKMHTNKQTADIYFRFIRANSFEAVCVDNSCEQFTRMHTNEFVRIHSC